MTTFEAETFHLRLAELRAGWLRIEVTAASRVVTLEASCVDDAVTTLATVGSAVVRGDGPTPLGAASSQILITRSGMFAREELPVCETEGGCRDPNVRSMAGPALGRSLASFRVADRFSAGVDRSCASGSVLSRRRQFAETSGPYLRCAACLDTPSIAPISDHGRLERRAERTASRILVSTWPRCSTNSAISRSASVSVSARSAGSTRLAHCSSAAACSIRDLLTGATILSRTWLGQP